MFRSTIGQLVVNDSLPDDLRDYNRELDKKGLSTLLAEVAKRHPEKYREVSHKLSQIGQRSAYLSGGHSFGLKHLLRTTGSAKLRDEFQSQLTTLLDDDSLSDQERETAVLKLADAFRSKQVDTVYDDSIAEGNPLAHQLKGAGRGNKFNLASLRGSDVLYADHRGHPIPVPVLRSYSEGLSPAEYWASTYGARTGLIGTKLSVQESGYLSKILNQVAHRAVVTELENSQPDATPRGLPVDVEDRDSEGGLLAMDAGGYKRNTILTPKILRHLKEQGVEKILVRSPAVTGSPDGGVYALDVGIREKGGLPNIGENIALGAAQGFGESIAQSSLGSKHIGGVIGSSKSLGLYDTANNLIQIPKTFRGGAAHTTLDGRVQSVEAAPAGGFHVTVEGTKHYVPQGFNVLVKPGDVLEAGDVLSEGIPNPSEIVKYKGIGEGRRYFIDSFSNAYKAAGMKSHRRNVELLARGLINHVKLTSERDNYIPDDVVSYNYLESQYQPREGFKVDAPKNLIGKYLERPYLHYTIGTKIRPSMLKTFDTFGIKAVDAHPDPPEFEPVMVRGMDNLSYDPDFMTNMLGSGLKGSLLDAVHRGGTSNENGTSYVPSLAKAVDFGHGSILKTPGKPINPHDIDKNFKPY